mmetsp:Transcript_1667/g.3647  ORF Transcript_1667/g.3647 Transcript_1667/m.3647 type:complete len:228 (-) Transcript_1667:279-962(-)
MHDSKRFVFQLIGSSAAPYYLAITERRHPKPFDLEFMLFNSLTSNNTSRIALVLFNTPLDPKLGDVVGVVPLELSRSMLFCRWRRCGCSFQQKTVRMLVGDLVLSEFPKEHTTKVEFLGHVDLGLDPWGGLPFETLPRIQRRIQQRRRRRFIVFFYAVVDLTKGLDVRRVAQVSRVGRDSQQHLVGHSVEASTGLQQVFDGQPGLVEVRVVGYAGIDHVVGHEMDPI